MPNSIPSYIRITLNAILILVLQTVPSAAQFVSFRDETGANSAETQYGVSGTGVTVVIMDRGIDWDHPDFLKPDGTTRIKWIYDMSPDHAAPVEISAAQINAALQGGTTLTTRDAVGHGTATAALAVGNGSAAGDGAFRGMAPDADVIIVKATSEGAPAHGSQPAESPFQASLLDALEWVDDKITELGQPAVGLFNAGVQWGPIDGSSPVSRKIDEVFGADRPGRVYVAPSGDEGNFANHARATFDDQSDAIVSLEKTSDQTAYMQIYYTGGQPANVTLELDDGTIIGPVAPNAFADQSGVRLFHYLPDADVGELQTTVSGDRLVWIEITGHATTGRVRLDGLASGIGTVDLYAPTDGALTSPIEFADHLAVGRLTDFASTSSAIVAGAYVLQTEYIDVDGIPRSAGGEGDPGELWTGSSGGPTRDGRLQGVDIASPGHNAFAAYAQESYWATLDFNKIEGGDGWYGRHGATSAAAPLVVGAVALLLEAAPHATANQIRELLRNSAIADGQTGPTPNAEWGSGKLDVAAALDLACSMQLADRAYCTPLGADVDDDDDVDGLDFLIIQRSNMSLLPQWESEFGSIATTQISSRQVPEPDGWILAMFGIVLCLSIVEKAASRFKTTRVE